jgi:ADP-ribosylglycohydrolase
VIIDRARGALWGQAIGDALGTTQEFSQPRDRAPFPEINVAPQNTIVGGGPFHLEAGRVTDDTEMAVCLAESLTARGRYDGADVARRYVAWMKVAFDIGNQTRASLSRIAEGTSVEHAGYDVWEASGRQPAGNGSLMRISPVAVFFAADDGERREAAIRNSAMTHADPRCQIACAAFTRAIAHAITDPDATPESMHRAAGNEIAHAKAAISAHVPARLTEEAALSLADDLELASRPDPMLDPTENQGFVRIAFRLAFWELLHAGRFERAVLDATNRGGDADTNAAIAGALYGSIAGEEAIPKTWRDIVERAGSDRDAYHPRRLFSVIR